MFHYTLGMNTLSMMIQLYEGHFEAMHGRTKGRRNEWMGAVKRPSGDGCEVRVMQRVKEVEERCGRHDGGLVSWHAWSISKVLS